MTRAIDRRYNRGMRINIWTVYYGLDKDGKLGWHCYQDYTYAGAKAWGDAVLREGWTQRTFCVEAPTRYQAIRIAKHDYASKLLLGSIPL